MSITLLLVVVMVFASVFLLVQGLVVPVFGESGRTRKMLRRRLTQIENESGEGSFVSLLRKDYLDNLTPFQRQLEQLPGMARLRQMLEQAGLATPAWQVLMQSVLVGAAAGLLALLFLNSWILMLAAALAAGSLPIMRVLVRRRERMAQFEQSLPDAIDLIKRAMRAGQPFPMALKLVGDDMEGPIAREFQITAADMAYGNDPRRAMLGMLSRVPSVALMGFITAVLLQRETGGNLAEILEQISAVIRGRYRFQRRVRTLSAEGRMSAWVLTLIPVALTVGLMLTTPEYLPVLFKDPLGQKLLLTGSVLMTLGILWMRKIIRIEY